MFTQKGIYIQWKLFLNSVFEKVYLVQRDQTISKPVYEYLGRFCTDELTSQDDQLMKLSSGLSSGISLNDFNTKDYRAMLWQLVVCTSVETFDSKPGLAK